MDVNGLLTFLGLLIAAWSILPRDAKMRLGWSFSVPNYVVICAAFLHIHYLVLYDSFQRLGFGVERIGVERLTHFFANLPFSNGDTAYIVVCLASLYVARRLHKPRLSPKRLRQMVEGLDDRGDVAAILAVLERNVDGLVRYRAVVIRYSE